MPFSDPKKQEAYFRDYDKKRGPLRNQNKRTVRRELLHRAKAVPCADCGHTYPYWIMQFDHVRGEKRFVLSRPYAQSIEAILDEVAKCDVVCANCHANRTFLRRDYEHRR